MNKTCRKCGENKGFDDFYKSKGKPISYCKACYKKLNQKNYQDKSEYWSEYAIKNKDRILEYQRTYYSENKVYVDKRSKKYYKNNSEKIRESMIAWKRDHLEANRAHVLYKKAVRRGEIVPLDKCELCGSDGKLDFHHHLDHYDKFLDGVYLCRKCHKRYHFNQKEIVKKVDNLYFEKFKK